MVLPTSTSTNESTIHNISITSSDSHFNLPLEEFLSDFNALPENSITPRKRKLIRHIQHQNKHIGKQKKLILAKRSNISSIKKKKVKHSVGELTKLIGRYVSGDVLTFMLMQLRTKITLTWKESEKTCQ